MKLHLFQHFIQSKKDSDRFKAWIARGQGWEKVGDQVYPRYSSWTLHNSNGLHFDQSTTVEIVPPPEGTYRIGRPRASLLDDGTWELRVTSDTYGKVYSMSRYVSKDGITFEQTNDNKLPLGAHGYWDDQMTCYPAQLKTTSGQDYLFYNGNDMGRTGSGYAKWK